MKKIKTNERYKLNFKEIEKNSLPLLHQTFFKTQREKGYPYFASTRVGSCKYIKIKNGKSLAIPFYIINSKGLTLNHFKTIPKKLYTSKSTYMHDYIKRTEMHCGMKKKPLLPYSMNCSRNQLPIRGIVSEAAANRSCFELGDNRLINRKQWKTTYRDFYRKPTFIPISNMGICANMAKAEHMKLTAL